MYVAKTMLLLCLFFSHAEAINAFSEAEVENTADCMWLRTDLSSPLFIVLIFARI